MSDINLEELVKSYQNGSTSFISHNYPITYELYEELFDILSCQGINVQEAMTVLLPQINKTAVPPQNNIKFDKTSEKNTCHQIRQRMK